MTHLFMKLAHIINNYGIRALYSFGTEPVDDSCG